GFSRLRRLAYRPIDDRSSAHPISSRPASRPCRRSVESAHRGLQHCTRVLAHLPRCAVGHLFGSSHKERFRSGQSSSGIRNGGEMNLQLMFEIAKLALSVVDTHLEGKDQDFSVETRLVQIIRTGVQAYHQHTGEPLDPALIKVEEPL